MLTAEELIALKAKVKAEMQRRCYYGSLTKFAGSAYDFTETPVKGGKIRAEQGLKVIEPLLQICDKGYLNIDRAVKGGKIPNAFDTELSTWVDTLAKEEITGDSTSCRGACTGLCMGTCSTTCTGCSSTCTGTCGGNCSKSCGGSCTGG